MAKKTALAALVAVLVALFVMLWSFVGHGADSPIELCSALDEGRVRQFSSKLAVAFFKRGTVTFVRKQYGAAASSFIASYRATPAHSARVKLLYNIAVSLDKAGERGKAAEIYRCYLATGEADVEEEFELKGRIVVLEAGQAGRPIEPLVKSLEIKPLEAPASAPSASKPVAVKFTPASAPALIRAPARSLPKIDFDLSKSTVFAPFIVSIPPVVRIPEVREKMVHRRPARAWAWILAGSGVALLGAGAGFGISAKTGLSSLEDSCGRTSAGCPANDIHSVEDRALIANICYSAGGAAAIASVVLFLIDYVGQGSRRGSQ